MKKLVVVFAMFVTVAAFAAAGDNATVVTVDPSNGTVTVIGSDGATRVAIVVGQSVQVGDQVREIGNGRVVADH